jgi:DNA-binding CsgD family transcriptional regulator
MLREYLDEIERCGTAATLAVIVTKACEELEFDKFVLARRIDGPTRAILHRLPHDWLALRYRSLEAGGAEKADPLVRHVVSGGVPTPWNSDGKVMFTRREIRCVAPRLLGIAGEFGLRTGVTIPLRSTGMNWSYMNFICGARRGLFQMMRPLSDANLLAHFVDAAMRRFQGAVDRRPPLSSRETEVLRWAAVGKTSWEISQILRISERTVNLHVANACRKLAVRGRSAACARALAEGWILI